MSANQHEPVIGQSGSEQVIEHQWREGNKVYRRWLIWGVLLIFVLIPAVVALYMLVIKPYLNSAHGKHDKTLARIETPIISGGKLYQTSCYSVTIPSEFDVKKSSSNDCILYGVDRTGGRELLIETSPTQRGQMTTREMAKSYANMANLTLTQNCTEVSSKTIDPNIVRTYSSCKRGNGRNYNVTYSIFQDETDIGVNGFSANIEDSPAPAVFKSLELKKLDLKSDANE